jgi:hypothetical protein
VVAHGCCRGGTQGGDGAPGGTHGGRGNRGVGGDVGRTTAALRWWCTGSGESHD